MQKYVKIIFAFLFSVMFITTVDAAKTCSTSEQAEINSLVSNIRGAYQEREEEVSDDFYDNIDGYYDEETEKPTIPYFEISITNLNNKVYAVVTNDYNDETKTYTYNDVKDGIVTFEWLNLDEIVNFKIEIYTSTDTGCPNELQRAITLRTPRLNEYYNYEICNENPNFNLCQKFVTFEPVDYDTFIEKVNNYNNKKDKKDEAEDAEEKKDIWEKITDFVTANKYYFIGGGITGVVVAVIVKKQRSSEL